MMCTMIRSAAALLVTLFLAAVSSVPAAQRPNQDATVDLMIVNGRVYSGAGTFHEAVAISGNRVLQVGRTADIEQLRTPATEVIDAGGRAVLPGFNDSHVHFVAGGFALQDVDLSGLTTVREVQAAISAFASRGVQGPREASPRSDRKPEESWVRGRGWLYSPFPGGLPTKQQLDEVVPDRPAIMECYDGHSIWVNSKALQLAGITAATPDPKNGVIVKDPKTGEPTGVLKEAAQALVNAVLPRPTREDRRAALRAAVAEAHRVGVTSVQNANGSADDFGLYAEAQQAGDLKVRMYSALSISPGFTEAAADAFEAVRARHRDDPGLRGGIVKIMSDGVIESRTAAMLAPYEKSTSSGTPNYSVEELDRIIALMDRRGWQIEVHAIGDRAVRMTLDAFERAGAANPPPARGRRHRIEHIETIQAADIPRFGKLGVIASQQPMHVVLGDMNTPGFSGPWPDNIGRDRASRAWSWKSIIDAGGRATFGSDWPVATLDPLQGIWLATTRLAAPGMRDQKLSMQQAIDGYTSSPAYASFEEQRKGTLAPGMLADVVILSRDIFARPPVKPEDIVVDATIFDGKIVYRR
jgi:predicted amidohydrolase YtcJ